VLVAIGLLALCSCSSGGPAQPGSTTGNTHHSPVNDVHVDGNERPDRMLRLTIRLTQDGAEVIDVVEATNTINRRDPHLRSRAFYRAHDSTGEVLIERGFRLEDHIRAEVPGEGGQLEGQLVPLEERIITLTVPAYDDLQVIRLYRSTTGGDRKDAELLAQIRP
jgi:hypothetical protein